ncbi:CidA/LrgA family protein [Acinetobacter sp. SWAC57]|uniref:CidA/LrgA family protein n=1 Tax=Acinetobacter sp. SWAC57 TaxID=2293834 RepID=UPI000E5C27C1|nr:CidA/LrgA family protein [Acinetobacter sp. SWAC57]RGD90606.1 CidA/LrgA family protein [Acinetobacter sp. SWAC57]
MRPFKLVYRSILQVGLLMTIWYIGTFVQATLSLPVSGGVVGLTLLLIALLTGLFKLEWIKSGSDLLLTELLLFFIPCVIGLIKYKHLFLTQGWQLVLSIVVGTICVMTCTAYCVSLGFKLEEKFQKKTKRPHQLNTQV